MSELEEVRASGKMSERVLENNFRIFDHRLREMEGELKLYPYATLSEVVVWAEQLKITIGKIKLIQESSIIKSEKEWENLQEKMLDYVKIDSDFIQVFSHHVIFLVQLEQRYRQRLSIFANNLDNSVRYLKRYADYLEKQGFPISGILAESKNLSDMNWLSILNY
jgi:tRNA U34 5-carboxymethylaminomethyl modifying enzyme MnmG/GidA